MKSKFLLLIPILILFTPLWGQVKTFINIETGPSWNMIKVVDQGHYFKNGSIYGTFSSITIDQELIKNLTIGTGVYYQSFRDGIQMDDERPGVAEWDGFTGLQFPLRMKYRIQFFEFPISFTPGIGYILGINSFASVPYTANSLLNAPDGSAFAYTVNQTMGDELLHMVETGFTLGFTFPGLWQVGLNLFYSKGFTEPSVSEISYTDQSSVSRTASYHSHGDNVRLSMNLMVPISNIWQQKDQRLRKKIERSYGAGKKVKEGKDIYFGGDVGALWRFFQHTNPAIAPRPMEKSGLFRYANFKAGGYAGMMLNSYLGLDVGVYYQRSNTFFAVMYDHEVDYVHKTGGPMFLEVPVKLRYFHTIIRDKLDLAIYAGGALITHFSSTDFGSGDAAFSYTSPQTGTVADGTLSYSASRTSRFGGALKAGLGVEYRLPMRFPLIGTFYADYSHGYIKIDEIGITTSVQENPAENSISYKGNGLGLSLGVKVPFILDAKGTSKCGALPRRR